MIHPKFVDHLVFRVAELERTERFYSAVLGQSPSRATGSIIYQTGRSRTR
jgi:glyoxylase I family protein